METSFNKNTGGNLGRKSAAITFDLMSPLQADAKPKKGLCLRGAKGSIFLDFEQDGETADIDDHAFVVH